MKGVSETVNKQLANLFNRERILAVYLYGSRADGTAHEQSDYDLGVLLRELPTFDETVKMELRVAEEAAKIVSSDVDVITLNTATIEQRFLVIKRGVLIYSSDDNLRTDFEDVVMRDYLDFKPFLDTFRQEVREAIKGGGFYG